MTDTKKQQRNHRSDTLNGNWGTPGTNITWDRAQGNRGKQLNPNQHPQPKTSANSGRGTPSKPSGRRAR